MDFPQWVTPSNLGTYSQDYSFDVNPITIQYSASATASISEINGSLPAGLRIEKTGYVIKVLGVCIASSSDIISKFTLRITELNGTVADRTFNLTLQTVKIPPSWENQNAFLGYQNSVLPQGYLLKASVPAGEHITYSIVSTQVLPVAAVSVSINPQTGVLLCDASGVVTNNTIITVVVRAATSVYSDIVCTIEVITIPGAPEWLTPAGTLGTFIGDDFLEINLLAKDLNDQPVSYALVSNPNNAFIEIASDGLLYGRLNNVSAETVYSFTASATNSIGTSFRTFDIIVIPNESLSSLEWITESNLGTVKDGTYLSIPLLASTKRNGLIIYNLVGGILPPNLIINKSQGSIEGFCEYHAEPKTYNFDVSADDGYQTVIKQFKLTVEKVYSDIFFGIDIPLMGNERTQWINDASALRIREPGTTIFDSLETYENPPRLNLIRGLETGYADNKKIYNQIEPWLHNLNLQFGSASNTEISGTNSFVYRNIYDYQGNSNVSVYSSAVFNTNVQTNGIVTPISLENIRNELTSLYDFVSAGGGNGLIISPVLNWSTGGLESVTVINTGKNYLSPPVINVLGSGQGAAVRAVLGIVDLKITDVGSNWQIGDVIEFQLGRYLSAGQITVTDVSPTGNIISWTIDTPGDYYQVPSLTTWTVEKNTYTNATFEIIWGIPKVQVVSTGTNYQTAISFNTQGPELLPTWQKEWFPAVGFGNINAVSGSLAAESLNSNLTIYGNTWTPNYFVFYWEGIKWYGKSSFDDEFTTFDGDNTRFEETESAYETIFDNKMTYFDNSYTEFDYQDPLAYNNRFVYGSTIFNRLLTTYEFYATRFDQILPIRTSSSLYPVLIRVNNRTYSGNNAVY
jgi:hypothetical protein